MSIARRSIVRILPFILVAGFVLAACGTDDSDSNSNNDQTGSQSSVSTATTGVADPTSTEDPGNMAEESTEAESAVTETSDDSAQGSEGETVDLAPELGSIDSWHNSPPLTLADLRGSPVLLVFWADF